MDTYKTGWMELVLLRMTVVGVAGGASVVAATVM